MKKRTNPWPIQTLSLLVGFFLACAGHPVEGTMPTDSPVLGPRVRILGIAQDGGLPHAACSCPRCDAARKDPTLSSPVASLGIITPDAQKAYLIDASPDIIEQLDAMSDVRDLEAKRVDRTPVDGIFLTHAHMGHYLGLAHLGFEAINTRALPLWASASMASFLKQNAPWSQLIELKNLEMRPFKDGDVVTLDEGVEVKAVHVPHRAEYTDTFAFIMKGTRKSVLYVPDISPWHKLNRPLADLFAHVDVALVDGTFYSGDELPGRDTQEIGHPLIVDTMELLQSRVDAGTLKVYFVHLNHSNPALDPNSEEREHLESRGFFVGWPGMEFEL
jgi:pyrroloquinoline quinone biosynthesis protein B